MFVYRKSTHTHSCCVVDFFSDMQMSEKAARENQEELRTHPQVARVLADPYADVLERELLIDGCA